MAPVAGLRGGSSGVERRAQARGEYGGRVNDCGSTTTSFDTSSALVRSQPAALQGATKMPGSRGAAYRARSLNMVSIAETVGRVQVQDIEGQEQPAEVGGGSFVSLGNGVEVNPVTVEARREVLPSEVEPQMFTNGHTCRVLCDRPEDSIKADAYAYVFITARAEGDRMFLVANAHEWRHARRQDMPCKSLGVSAGVEMRVEAAALRNPGGCVVEMND